MWVFKTHMPEISTPALAPQSRENSISYKALMNRACESIEHFRPAVEGLPVEKRGVAHTEMFFVYAVAASLKPRQILESGRARGQSTLVLSRCFPESRIVSVEMDESSPDAKFALERLSPLKNVKLLFGDAREVLPATMQVGDVVIIDGPKEFRAIKLALNLLRTGKPSLIFIHDFYAGSAERRFLERHMPDAFFSDAPEFLRAFAGLDGKDGSVPRRWNAFACIVGGRQRNYFLLSILLWLSRSLCRLSEKLRLRRNGFPARHAGGEGAARASAGIAVAR
jgi:predicted O-methyltransferase YrrM